MVVLKEVIFTLGGCHSLGRTNFGQFSLWKDMVILKGLILYNFHFESVWWSCKDEFFSISLLGRCCDLETTDFQHFKL